MYELREKCPWDKKQTIESLRHLTIEEVYELSEAILSKNYDDIKSELGDVLLHIVFYSKIASETSMFDIADVMNALCDKLVHRHPHIYGDVEVLNEEDVKKNWEQIKLKEKKSLVGILNGVPTGLPSLIKAQRIQEKVSQVGFDWANEADVWNKVEEEFQELKHAKSPIEQELEFGDLLFSLVNYARKVGINADKALEMTNRKFKCRFEFLEQEAASLQVSLSEVSLAQMDLWWKMAKQQE